MDAKELEAAAKRLVAQGYDTHEGEFLRGPNGEVWSRTTDAHYVARAYLQLVNTHAAAPAMFEALQKAQHDVCSLRCPSTKKTGEEWTHSPECIAIRTALAAAS